MPTVFQLQIADVVRQAGPLWKALDGKKLLLTGGTGFFGLWLLESLVAAQASLGIRLEAHVLTRDPARFHATAPHLASSPHITLHQGDVRHFTMAAPDFAYIIHGAATSARATFDGEDPLTKFTTAYDGTRRVLDLAVQARAQRVLMLSSGSVYGGLSHELGAVAETHAGAPATLDTEAALSHGKRAAEFLCACAADTHGLNISIARCFSFVGAHLPLDIHYAIGNFIHDALHEDSITVRGDGTPLRSYLFAGDLVIWLMTLLLHGAPRRIYNVGSDRMISLGELAVLVRDVLAPHKQVRVLGQAGGGARSCYVPDISLARAELGLDVWTSLADAIAATAVVLGGNFRPAAMAQSEATLCMRSST